MGVGGWGVGGRGVGALGGMGGSDLCVLRRERAERGSDLGGSASSSLPDTLYMRLLSRVSMCSMRSYTVMFC